MELILQQMPIVVHSLNIGFLQTLRLFLVTLIGAFQLYDQVYVLTSGGPANSTLTPVYLIWQNSFGDNAGPQAGYAAAQSFVLFVIIMLVTLLVRRFDRDTSK